MTLYLVFGLLSLAVCAVLAAVTGSLGRSDLPAQIVLGTLGGAAGIAAVVLLMMAATTLSRDHQG